MWSFAQSTGLLAASMDCWQPRCCGLPGPPFLDLIQPVHPVPAPWLLVVAPLVLLCWRSTHAFGLLLCSFRLLRACFFVCGVSTELSQLVVLREASLTLAS